MGSHARHAPFGVESEVLVGPKRVNAIPVNVLQQRHMPHSETVHADQQHRAFKPNVGGGVQGHEGQFLAMLAQSQISADYPSSSGKIQFSVKDLAR